MRYRIPHQHFTIKNNPVDVLRLVAKEGRNHLLVNAFIESLIDIRGETTFAYVLAVEIGIIFALSKRYQVLEAVNIAIISPRAVEIFVAFLVELHTLPVEFLFDEKLLVAHLLDGLLDLLGRPAA